MVGVPIATICACATVMLCQIRIGYQVDPLKILYRVPHREPQPIEGLLTPGMLFGIASMICDSQILLPIGVYRAAGR